MYMNPLEVLRRPSHPAVCSSYWLNPCRNSSGGVRQSRLSAAVVVSSATLQRPQRLFQYRQDHQVSAPPASLPSLQRPSIPIPPSASPLPAYVSRHLIAERIVPDAEVELAIVRAVTYDKSTGCQPLVAAACTPRDEAPSPVPAQLFKQRPFTQYRNQNDPCKPSFLSQRQPEAEPSNPPHTVHTQEHRQRQKTTRQERAQLRKLNHQSIVIPDQQQNLDVVTQAPIPDSGPTCESPQLDIQPLTHNMQPHTPQPPILDSVRLNTRLGEHPLQLESDRHASTSSQRSSNPRTPLHHPTPGSSYVMQSQKRRAGWKYRHVATILGTDVPILKRQYSLLYIAALQLSDEELALQAASLTRILQLQPGMLLLLLSGQPSLLTLSVPIITYRVAALRELLSASAAEIGQLLVADPDVLAYNRPYSNALDAILRVAQVATKGRTLEKQQLQQQQRKRGPTDEHGMQAVRNDSAGEASEGSSSCSSGGGGGMENVSRDGVAAGVELSRDATVPAAATAAPVAAARKAAAKAESSGATAAAGPAAAPVPEDEALWKALLRAVRTRPGLLLACDKEVTGVIQELSSQLGLTPIAAAQLAVRQPSLLCSPRARLASNIAALVSTFKLDPPTLLQLVEAMPQLLVASPGPLSANVKFFHKIMAYSPAYSVQLPKLIASPHNLAVALSFDWSRFHRLQYLVMTGRDRGIGYKTALSMVTQDFHEMYPGYQLWRHEWGRGPSPLPAKVEQQYVQ